MNKDDILSAYTKKNNLIFYFIFDADGNVKECNTFASDFIKRGASVFHLKEVFVDFKQKIDLNELSKMPETEHVLSVNSFSGVPDSFYFTFYKIGDEYLVLGRLDIMELETFHYKLIELNNELSNISRELQKSNAELKKLNELKNTFLGMAAHDIRKPLTVIKGYLSLMLNGAVENQPEKFRQYLTAIDNSARGMQAIINNFLDISVIESGKLKLAYTEFNLKDKLQEMLYLNIIKAENRKIKLIIDAGGEDFIISADKDKLQQVLDNITGNAIEYTHNGGTVILRLERLTDSIKITVEDEGPGIPENAARNLFKAFGRTNVVKVSGEMSTGLGLLISKKIVEEHGGTIAAENKPDKGARFYFTIPIHNNRG